MASTAQRKSYLEGLVSKTKKFRVEDLLDLYRVYDDLIINHIFCGILYPHSRAARSWVRDQVRDLVAGTDRNRLILTSRARKASEEVYTGKDTVVKPKNQQFFDRALMLLRRYDTDGYCITADDVREMGLSRLVADDMGLYMCTLLQPYPDLVVQWTEAKVSGDHNAMMTLDAQMAAIETEVGVSRDDAWYVATNLLAIYDQIRKMTQHVCLAYTRLLFRFAHQLRGHTTTDENFSAGYQGLVNAARNYDPSDGSSFTSHCAWWVKSSIIQRQRQSSVIQTPTTTKSQLAIAERDTSDASAQRLSVLRGRADLFFAGSHRAGSRRSDEDSDEVTSYDAQMVTSPDAEVVLGSSYYRAQHVEDGYQTSVEETGIRDAIAEVFKTISETDPSLLFPYLLWSLNAGIDASLLAGAASQLFSTSGNPLDSLKHLKQ